LTACVLPTSNSVFFHLAVSLQTCYFGAAIDSITYGMTLTLSVLPETFAICLLDRNAQIPSWAKGGSLSSITRTSDEVSVVCPEECIPEGVQCEGGWKCLKIKGPFDLSTVGILASIAEPLAKADLSIFVISSFDTDHVLIKKRDVERAVRILSDAGHRIKEFAMTTP